MSFRDREMIESLRHEMHQVIKFFELSIKERDKLILEAAQAEKFERVAKAEAERQEREEAAKAKAFEVTAAAKADAESVKAAAKADAYRKTQNAIALKKEGLAKAAVEKALKVSKYDGVAGKRQYLVDVENAKSDRLKNANISGVVTEKTFMMLTDGKSLNNAPTVTIPVKE